MKHTKLVDFLTIMGVFSTQNKDNCHRRKVNKEFQNKAKKLNRGKFVGGRFIPSTRSK